MSLKEKAVKGFSWTVVEGILSQGLLFVIGIILARLLSPEEIGLVGYVTAFIAVSTSIIDGGLSSALIRKIDATDKDYNTIFYSNMAIGIALYALLVIFAEPIGIYFKEPQLPNLLIVGGIALIINSFTVIQRTLYIIKLDFRTQAIIAIVSSIIAGTIAILMAYKGFGVWSLIALTLIRQGLTSILFWIFSTWYPSFIFSKESFKSLFNFGYKLLIAELMSSLYSNIYFFLIGKAFSTAALGYYTRANQFQAPFSSNITLAIRRISFPILSSIQNDIPQLRDKFRQFLRYSVLINFTVMASIAAIAEPMILLLIGEKWATSIFYLQLLCVPGMLLPLHALNLNLLAVKGHSDILLRLEVIKKSILVPLVIFTAFFSLEIVLYGLICFAFTEYFMNSYYSKRLIGYSTLEQVKDILPFLIIAVLQFTAMYSVTFLDLEMIPMILLQLAVGFLLFLIIHEKMKLAEYAEFKQKAVGIFKKFIKKRTN